MAYQWYHLISDQDLLDIDWALEVAFDESGTDPPPIAFKVRDELHRRALDHHPGEHWLAYYLKKKRGQKATRELFGYDSRADQARINQKRNK